MPVGGIDLNLLLTLRALLEEENVTHAGARLGLSQPSMSIERLARRAESETGVRVVEPPFGHVELVEAAWWHPSRP